jgi:MFS family permease
VIPSGWPTSGAAAPGGGPSADGPQGSAVSAEAGSSPTGSAPARSGATGGLRGSPLRLVLFLATALALSKAASNLPGAIGPSLVHHLHLTNGTFGLAASLANGLGALLALPAGMLADRHSPRRLLAASVVLWSVALVVLATAGGYGLLLVARLGAAAAMVAVRPLAVASVGAVTVSRQRGRALSIVDAGQALGTVAAYLVAAVSLALLDWRWAPLIIMAGSLSLLVGLRRLPNHQPSTAGAAGALPGADAPGAGATATGARGPPGAGAPGARDELGLVPTVRYLLRVPTNLVAIVADVIGTLFFAAITSFAVVFATGQYRVSAATADIAVPALGGGVVLGIVVGGRLADHRRIHGRTGGSRRVLLASGCYLLAAVVMLPAVATHSILAAAPLLVLGGTALAAASPVIDTIRVDVVRPGTRGRSEALRSLCLVGSNAAGPGLVGFLADRTAHGGQRGLEVAFVIVIGALALSGLVLLIGHRTYMADAAAAGS